MQTVLHWGQSPPHVLKLRDDAWVGLQASSANGATGGRMLSAASCNVVAAACDALQSPSGFPPIDRATVPGDRVAIAIGEGVRDAPDVVRGLVRALVAGGTEASATTVLFGSRTEADDLRSQLADLTAEGCTVVGHRADHQESLCYLAAVDEEPLLISRVLFEADVVIPVGCARLAGGRDARGPFESIFPRFSDVETQRRYARADSLDSPSAAAERRRKTDEVGWQLGAPLVVQVVPGRGGGVAQVVAGAPDDVDRQVQAALADHWTYTARRRAALVVVTLTGGPLEQTWANVARGLYSASQVADLDHSAVAVCTELETEPGETLRKLIDADGDLEQAARLGKADSADAAAAWEIYKARCRGPLYFMSRLNDDLVEDLGMTPLASEDELNRLAERSESCMVLDEGQHATATIVDQ